MRVFFKTSLNSFAAIAGLFLPATAMAAPGDTATSTGSAQLTVIEPIGIQNVADLRFGRLLAPATAGTVTMGPTGVVSEAGGMVGNTSTPQGTNGRGPGGFAIFWDGATLVRITTSTPTFTLSSGTNTMQVSNLTAARFSTTPNSLSITIGARLAVAANQPTGDYSGTYTLRADYF